MSAGAVQAVPAAPATSTPIETTDKPCADRDPALDLLAELDAGDATAQVAAELLRSYQRERVSLCSRIGDHLSTIGSLRESLASRQAEIALLREDRDSWKATASTAVLKGSESSGHHLMVCGVGGVLAYESDGTLRVSPGAACIIPMWPN